MYTVCIKNINSYWKSPEKFVFHKDNEYLCHSNNLDWIYNGKTETVRYFHETCQSNKILQCTHEKCKKNDLKSICIQISPMLIIKYIREDAPKRVNLIMINQPFTNINHNIDPLFHETLITNKNLYTTGKKDQLKTNLTYISDVLTQCTICGQIVENWSNKMREDF